MAPKESAADTRRYFLQTAFLQKAVEASKIKVSKKEAEKWAQKMMRAMDRQLANNGEDFEKYYEDRTWAVNQLLEYFERENLIETYRNELEYLVFENTYFVPSKEIVLNDRKSEYLKKFRDYAYNKFPQMNKNYYVQQIAGKDKILLKLLQYRMYGMMVLMSQLRRMKDRLAAVSRR